MRPTSQRGQVYPLFGIMLVVLIGVSALSVDIGYYRSQQRIQQAATDSAVLAAAQSSLYDSANSNNYQNAGLADAKQNGFTDGSTKPPVSVKVAAYTDAGNCASGCYQATVTESYPIFFGSMFKGFANSNGRRSIQTTAAARLQSGAGACLTSVGPITVQTKKNGNGGGITGPDCGIADADCTNVNGNGKDLNVASWSENAACGNQNSCAIASGSCTVGLPPVDPCSVTPQCQTLANATTAELGLNSAGTTCSSKSVITTSPFKGGCYQNQTFSGVMKPGLYVLTGTTILNTVTGTGVTLYFAKGATMAKEPGNGNGLATLSAPTIGSGDFSGSPNYSTGEEGIVAYQAADSSNLWPSIKLNFDLAVTGLAYLPNMTLESNGHAVTVTGDLAARSFILDGNGQGGGITLNPGNGTTTAGPEIPTLVE